MRANLNPAIYMPQMLQPRAQIVVPLIVFTLANTTIISAATKTPQLTNKKVNKLKKIEKCFNYKNKRHTVVRCTQPARFYLMVSALLQKIMPLKDTSNTLRKHPTASSLNESYNKLLIILLSLLPDDLFINEALVVPCKLDNKSEITTCFLLDTSAISIRFIDKKMARHVCHMFQILFLPLAKPKPLKRFDGKLTQC